MDGGAPSKGWAQRETRLLSIPALTYNLCVRQPSQPVSSEAAAEFVPAITRKATRTAIQIALIAGFGGLIVIIIAEGFYSLRIARQMQGRSEELRAGFLARERTLEGIRSDLFESGNAIRDYIAARDETSAAASRSDLASLQQHAESQLNTYSESLRPAEADAFRMLSSELATYWSSLRPALHWTPQQRQKLGDVFLQKEVLPRRTTSLAIAQEISQINEQSLHEEQAAIHDASARSETRLQLIAISGSSIGVLLALMTVLYTFHLENLSEQRYEQAVRIQRELQELSAKLVDAQESERRAISRELHDEVGQSLSSLLMEIDNLSIANSGAHSSQPLGLQKLRSLAQSSLHVVRDMSLLLRPSMLDDLGLVPALEWQAREVSRRTGLDVSVVEENVSETLTDEYKTCIYRVVQEALNNASKHAKAGKLDVLVRQELRQIILTIRDNGTGFDAQRVRGLGLVGVAERVNRLNGRLQIDSRPGSGTVLRVTLPLDSKPLASSGRLS